MDISKNTPTKEITIQGFAFSVPTPFAEGHVLTEVEAAVLNQTLAENLRNNFGAQIKKSKEDTEAAGETYAPDEAALQAAFQDYISEYEFGAKRGGGGVQLDPVERKARNLAQAAIKKAVQAKGLKVKDVGLEKIKELANNYYEANSEVLLKQAREVMDAEAAAAKATEGLSVEL